MYAVTYRSKTDFHDRAEWFDTEAAAKKHAEKVLKDGVRFVRLAKLVSVVHSEPVWVKS